MRQLRYLRSVQLDVAVKTKEENGSLVVSSYTPVSIFEVQFQELTDDVSASIYGADINRMYRIASPHGELESLLATKVNNNADNVSFYSILYDGMRYRIVAVRKNWIDIQLI